MNVHRDRFAIVGCWFEIDEFVVRKTWAVDFRWNNNGSNTTCHGLAFFLMLAKASLVSLELRGLKNSMCENAIGCFTSALLSSRSHLSRYLHCTKRECRKEDVQQEVAVHFIKIVCDLLLLLSCYCTTSSYKEP